MLTYRPDGSFIGSEQVNESGVQTYRVKNGTLAYYSYGSTHPYRLALLEKGDTACFLPTNAKVLNMSGNVPVFSEAGDGGVTFMDSYEPCIYEYKSGKVEKVLTFDFGKYSVPEAFFNYGDAFAAMQNLMGNDYAIVRRYFSDKNDKLAEIYLQKGGNPSFHYGLYNAGKWSWFYGGDERTSPLARSFRLFDGEGNLVCVMDLSLLGNLPSSLRECVTDNGVLDNLNQNSNCVIARIKLR